MAKSVIGSINCKVLDFFELPHNAIEIKNRLANFETEREVSLSDCADLIVASGAVTNLIFIKNNLNLNELKSLINELRFPLIFFQKLENRIIPTLITPGKKGAFELSGDVVGNNVNYTLTDKEHLLSLFEKLENSEEYLVLSCFPNNTQFNDDEEEFDSTSAAKNIDSVYYESGQKTFRRLLDLFNTERKDITHLYIYAGVVGLISLSLPLGVQTIVGFISSGQYSTSLIVLIFMIIIGIVLNGGIHIMQVWIVEIIQQRLFTKTAFDFAFRFPKLKKDAIKSYYPPELVNRFFDVLTLQKGFAKILIDLLSASIQVLFGLLLLSFYHTYFIAFGVLVISILVLILRVTGPKGLESSMYESKYKYQLVHWLQEVARSINSFKRAGFTNLPVDKTDHMVSSYLKSRNKHFKILIKQYISFVTFKTVITAGLLSLGCMLVINKEINLGQFVAAEIIIILLMDAVEKIIKNLDTFYDVLTSLEKIGTITDLPLEVNKGVHPNKVVVNNEGFNIKMKDLCYFYNSVKKPAVDNFNLEISSGSKICISGFKNAGKETLMKLLLGTMPPTSGGISYNSISLNDYNKTALFNYIGNTMDEELFDGSILENLTMGKSKIQIQDITKVLQLLHINDYIISLPDGINTHLTGGNIQSSKSMMNKIILGRALLKNPKLLIIDENFFANSHEKISIYDAIIKQYNHCTILFVSNDEKVMQLCNNIILMKDGKIVSSGHYDEIKNVELFVSLMK